MKLIVFGVFLSISMTTWAVPVAPTILDLIHPDQLSETVDSYKDRSSKGVISLSLPLLNEESRLRLLGSDAFRSVEGINKKSVFTTTRYFNMELRQLDALEKKLNLAREKSTQLLLPSYTSLISSKGRRPIKAHEFIFPFLIIEKDRIQMKLVDGSVWGEGDYLLVSDKNTGAELARLCSGCGIRGAQKMMERHEEILNTILGDKELVEFDLYRKKSVRQSGTRAYQFLFPLKAPAVSEVTIDPQKLQYVTSISSLREDGSAYAGQTPVGLMEAIFLQRGIFSETDPEAEGLLLENLYVFLPGELKSDRRYNFKLKTSNTSGLTRLNKEQEKAVFEAVVFQNWETQFIRVKDEAIARNRKVAMRMSPISPRNPMSQYFKYSSSLSRQFLEPLSIRVSLEDRDKDEIVSYDRGIKDINELVAVREDNQGNRLPIWSNAETVLTEQEPVFNKNGKKLLGPVDTMLAIHTKYLKDLGMEELEYRFPEILEIESIEERLERLAAFMLVHENKLPAGLTQNDHLKHQILTAFSESKGLDLPKLGEPVLTTEQRKQQREQKLNELDRKLREIVRGANEAVQQPKLLDPDIDLY